MSPKHHSIHYCSTHMHHQATTGNAGLVLHLNLVIVHLHGHGALLLPLGKLSLKIYISTFTYKTRGFKLGRKFWIINFLNVLDPHLVP